MKKSVQQTLLFLFLSICLVWSLGAADPDNTASTSDNQLRTLAELAAVATAAIHSAEHSVDVVQWIFTALATLATAIVGVIGYFGFKNVDSWIKGAQQQRDRFEAELKKITEDYHSNVSQEGALYVECLEVIRSFVLAKTMPEYSEEVRKSLFTTMTESLTQIMQEVSVSKNIRLYLWCYSMRGYLHKTLKDYAAAISDEEDAIKATEDYIREGRRQLPKNQIPSHNRMVEALEKRLTDKYYNLACYCCLQGDKDKWQTNLHMAVNRDSEFKNIARTDGDFSTVYEDPDFKAIIA